MEIQRGSARLRLVRHAIVIAMLLICCAGSAVADLPAANTLAFSNSLASAEPMSMTGSAFRMVGALFLCLGLFAGGMHLYRRYAGIQGTSMKRRLVVREKLPLTSKSSLMLVAFDGREFLIASGSEQVSLISPPPVPGVEFHDSLDEACESAEVFDV